MIKQTSQALFESEDKKIRLYCDTDIAWGRLHDFTMYIKGMAVEAMIQAHKLEEEEGKKKFEES